MRRTQPSSRRSGCARQEPSPLGRGQGEGSSHLSQSNNRTELLSFPTGTTAKDLGKTFGRVTKSREDRIEEILEALGKARELADGRYVAV